MAYGVDAGGRDAEGTALVVDVGGSACDASVVVTDEWESLLHTAKPRSLGGEAGARPRGTSPERPRSFIYTPNGCKRTKPLRHTLAFSSSVPCYAC